MKEPTNILGAGIAIGVAFGLATGNVGFGIALGVAIGASMSSSQKHKNKAAEIKPWDIICIIAPSIPITAPALEFVAAKIPKGIKKPKVTKPICEIDE